uniref:Uncharacterized protein n=1 Tax=Glossina palpalis gambiensis TaxID=67801 RepID=A0A1B0BCM4_9MUSC
MELLLTDLKSHPVVVVGIPVVGACYQESCFVIPVVAVIVVVVALVVTLVFVEFIVVVLVCALALMLDEVPGVIAVGGVGNVLKVGWQLSGGLSAPDLPAIVLAVAVAPVVGEQNDDGADEGVSAVDLGT